MNQAKGSFDGDRQAYTIGANDQLLTSAQYRRLIIAYRNGAPVELHEVAEVLASHYVDAYAALPDAEDAGEVKTRACDSLVRAGDRADSLGAAGEALRYLTHAAELTDEPRERAALLDRAGWLAVHVPDYDEAARLLAESIALYEAQGDHRSAARVSGRLAAVDGALAAPRPAGDDASQSHGAMDAVGTTGGLRAVEAAGPLGGGAGEGAALGEAALRLGGEWGGVFAAVHGPRAVGEDRVAVSIELTGISKSSRAPEPSLDSGASVICPVASVDSAPASGWARS